MGHDGRPLYGTGVEDSPNLHRLRCNPRGLVRRHPARCPRLTCTPSDISRRPGLPAGKGAWPPCIPPPGCPGPGGSDSATTSDRRNRAAINDELAPRRSPPPGPDEKRNQLRHLRPAAGRPSGIPPSDAINPARAVAVSVPACSARRLDQGHRRFGLGVSGSDRVHTDPAGTPSPSRAPYCSCWSAAFAAA